MMQVKTISDKHYDKVDADVNKYLLRGYRLNGELDVSIISMGYEETRRVALYTQQLVKDDRRITGEK